MWRALTLNFPTEVTGALNTASAGFQAVEQALEVVKAQARVLQSTVQLEEQSRVQLANQAIQLLTRAIAAALNAILDDAGLYVLVVPLPKKGLVRIGARNESTDELGSNSVDAPINALASQMTPAQQTRLRRSRTFARVFNPDEIFVGGNAYFVKTVAESLFDSGDVNRPKFTKESSFAYVAMLGGATDLTSVMALTTFLDRLLGGNRNGNSVSATRGVVDLIPQNVRVRPSNRQQFPVIEWDPVPATRILASYGNAQVVATQFAIIRSTDFRAKTAQRVNDLIPGELTLGATGLYGAKVVRLMDYDGLVSQYTDDEALEEGRPYFYHVAFRTRMDPSQEYPLPAPRVGSQQPPSARARGVDNGYDRLSGCVEYRVPRRAQAPVASQLAKPPDWTRSPSIATLLPVLSPVIDSVNERLVSLSKSAETASARNDAYIQFLDKEIARYARQATELQVFLAQLRSVLDGSSNGLYTTIRQGKGSAGDFLADLVNTIDDDADPNAPPFENGDEYVTGAVLLTVGPNDSAIAKGLALLQSLFVPQAATTEDEQVLAGITSVATIAAEVEQALIDEIARGAAPAVASATFNEDLTPRAPGEGDATCD